MTPEQIKLQTQLDAIIRYIDKLNKCDEEGKPLTEAYKEIVNELRVEAGMEPFDYTTPKWMEKYKGIATKKKQEDFMNNGN